MPITPRLLAPALAVMLALSACGDDDAQQATSGDTTTTAPDVTPGDGNGDGDGDSDGDDMTTTTGPPDEPECSGAEIMTTMEVPSDVPEPVATTLIAVRSAAQRCDYEGLAELALDDGTFTASFGLDLDDPDELAAYWRQQEAEEGEEITATMVHLTTMRRAETVLAEPDGTETTMYVAPRAQHEVDDTTRQEVLDVFGEEAEAWFVDGQYVGWRLGITEVGDWRFFVIGD